MKKQLLPLVTVLLASAAYSQVGIGTLSPNKSSQLEVTSNEKGILIPRVALQGTDDQVTISNGNVQSLLVYNTTDNEHIKPGYYYWEAGAWQRLSNQKDVEAIVQDFDTNTVNVSFSVIDGNLVLTDSEGNTTSISLSDINILTSVVTYQGKQYYLPESFVYGGGVVDPDNWTSVPQGVILIDVVGGVVNNVEEILNQPVNITVDGNTYTTVEEYLQYISNGATGNMVYIPGTGATAEEQLASSSFTYVDENGATQTVLFRDLIHSIESKTVIVKSGSKQYYVSEAYLVANNGIVPATIDENVIPSGIFLIDIVEGVSENIEEILSQPVNITVGGNTYTTVEEYLQYISNEAEGNMVYVPGTGATIEEQLASSSFTYVDTDGVTQTIVFKDLIQSIESKTVIVKSGTKQYYISESYLAANNGVAPTVIDENTIPPGIFLIDIVEGVSENIEEILNQPVNITVNGNTFTTLEEYLQYISVQSEGNMVYVPGTGTTLEEQLASSSFTYTDANGITQTISFGDLVKANQKVDSFNGTLPVSVTSAATPNTTGGTDYTIAVATANSSALGVVRQAAVNPTVTINAQGELEVDLAAATPIEVFHINHMVEGGDAILLGDASVNDVSFSLPDPTTHKGKRYIIKKNDTNDDNEIVVTGTIEGVSGGQLYTAVPYTGWELVSDGTAWIIINKF